MNQELHKEIKTIDEGTHRLSQFFEIKPCKIDIDALLFDSKSNIKSILLSSSSLFVVSVRKLLCCAQDCTSTIDFTAMMLARNKFQGLSSKGKNQWILDYLMDHKNCRYLS